MAFKKGQSGNPSGRPKDTTTASKVRKQIDTAIPEVIDNVVSQALDGDMQAAKILIDRVCPPLKSQALPIQIPAGETLTEAGYNVVDATMNGNVSPDIGASMITALSNQAKLVEMEELNKRLTRIEALLTK